MTATTSFLPRSLVLVGNPYSGHTRHGLERARQAIAREGLQLVEVVPMDNLDRLRYWIAQPDIQRPLIVAAGGDGTVGAVANYVVGTGAVLGIVPLGTSNDIARSLGLPMQINKAVHLLAAGKVSAVDVGKFFARDEPPRYFVHAAAMGLDVKFARLATQVSLRKRLGHFTYVAALLLAFRNNAPFTCEMRVRNRTIPLCLIHLSVMNAPIYGGRLRLRMADSDVDDRKLDVLAIENVGLPRIIAGAIAVLLGKRPHVGGTRLYHVRHLHVHIDTPLDVSLDGEIGAHIPGDFAIEPNALRVVTPLEFHDK